MALMPQQISVELTDEAKAALAGHAAARTPISQDKRLMVVAFSILGVFALTALGKPPNSEALTWLGAVVMGYIGQSQWGQTKRAMGAPQP